MNINQLIPKMAVLLLALAYPLLLVNSALAQTDVATARAQIIHNAADPAAESVDIYVNGDLFVDDLSFRSATPFRDVPAETSLLIEIYPAGANPDLDDPAFTLDGAEFAVGQVYTIIANGLLADGFAGNPEGIGTGFDLYVLPSAEAHEEEDETAFFIWHGATDAPGVDVFARDVIQLADDLRYLESTDYITVPPALYIIDLAPADTDEVIASFFAPLSELGGEVITVLASGFLDPSANNDGEAFGLLVVLNNGFTQLLPPAELPEPATASAQIIHNSADPAAEVVDIYVNGGLFVDSLAFRDATPFVDVPADTPLLIEIYPHGANPDTDNPAYTLDEAVFAEGETYTIIANGLIGDGFAENPSGVDTEFDLFLFQTSEAHDDADEASFFIFHGATDAPGVDVFARDVVQLSNDLRYLDNTEYIDVPAAAYTIDVAPAGTGNVIASFTAPLSDLGGQALTVLASGFLDPSANNNGEAFGLLAVLADGTTLLLPATDLPAETFSVTFQVDMRFADDFNPETRDVFMSGSMFGWDQPGTNPDAKMGPAEEGSDIYTLTLDLEAGDYAYKYFLAGDTPTFDLGEWDGDPNRTVNITGDTVLDDFFGIQPDEPIIARAQIIHNSADPAAEVVDIYVNGGLFVDSLAFREATPFVDVPAAADLMIEIYGHGADPAEDAPAFTIDGVRFEPFETYAVIANGVIADGFAANPDEVETAFGLFVLPARESHGNSEEAAFYIWHGSTDAPAVDVFARDVAPLADELAYTDATDYIAVPAADYTIDLTPAGVSDVVASFIAPLEGAGGAALGVLASGFFDPAGNNDGPAFGLLAVFVDGTTVLLPAATTNSEPVVDLPNTFRLEQNYPNPFNPVTQIEFSLPETANVTLEVFNIQGQRVATLVDGNREAGVHTVSFDAVNLASGVYLYRIQAGDFTKVNKMMLVK